MLLRRLVACAVALCLTAPVAAAGDPARVKAERARLEALAAKKGDILDALDQLRTQEDVEQAAYHAAEKQVDATSARLTQVRRDLATTRARLKARLKVLAPRLVARYKLGKAGYLPLLFSAGDFHELLRRKRLLDRVIDSDLAAMAEVRRLRAKLSGDAARLETGEKALESLRASAAARLARARAARQDREAALAAVEHETALRQRTLAALERAAHHLQKVVKALPASQAGGFAAKKGHLPLPAAGAIEVGFGTQHDSRYDTVVVHKGVDIRAPKGAPVRAVAGGRVVHAGWLRGYGNLIIVDHGGGYYTLMAHLDRMDVKTGQKVHRGETLGLVGDTGSLKGAYLYFEIRDGGRAVDPAPWFSHR